MRVLQLGEGRDEAPSLDVLAAAPPTPLLRELVYLVVCFENFLGAGSQGNGRAPRPRALWCYGAHCRS